MNFQPLTPKISKYSLNDNDDSIDSKISNEALIQSLLNIRTMGISKRKIINKGIKYLSEEDLLKVLSKKKIIFFFLKLKIKSLFLFSLNFHLKELTIEFFL